VIPSVFRHRKYGSPAEVQAGSYPSERRRSESNRRMEVLQTSALPLGYGAGRERKIPDCKKVC